MIAKLYNSTLYSVNSISLLGYMLLECMLIQMNATLNILSENKMAQINIFCLLIFVLSFFLYNLHSTPNAFINTLFFLKYFNSYNQKNSCIFFMTQTSPFVPLYGQLISFSNTLVFLLLDGLAVSFILLLFFFYTFYLFFL